MFPHSEQKIEFICNFGKSLVKKNKQRKQHTLIQNYPDGCFSAEGAQYEKQSAAYAESKW